jgi:hypothetical protein
MSDDMLLTREHAAADIYSPLFGAAVSFKTNGYSTTSPPTEADAQRFGEKVCVSSSHYLESASDISDSHI